MLTILLLLLSNLFTIGEAAFAGSLLFVLEGKVSILPLDLFRVNIARFN